jgi:hypothetical protein
LAAFIQFNLSAKIAVPLPSFSEEDKGDFYVLELGVLCVSRFLHMQIYIDLSKNKLFISDVFIISQLFSQSLIHMCASVYVCLHTCTLPPSPMLSAFTSSCQISSK